MGEYYGLDLSVLPTPHKKQYNGYTWLTLLP